jgi:predicted dienelactone hydrolase
MYPSEVVFVLLLAGFLVAQTHRAVGREYVIGCFVACLAVLVVGAVLGQLRWQMAPAYLLFVILSFLLLRRAHSHILIRSSGVFFGGVLLTLSLFLALALPILGLPSPHGPFAVGSTSFTVLDASRDQAFFGRPGEPRELYVHVWYPGVIAAGAELNVRTLWEEMYVGRLDPFSLFMGYLRGIPTHSYKNIPLSSQLADYPAIVFSHGLMLMAEQNTLLMEHLASHGYMVLGVSHTSMSARVTLSDGRVIPPDFDKIFGATAQLETVDVNALDARSALAGTPEGSASVQREYLEKGTALNALMEIWVDDLRFVVDEIEASTRHGREQAQGKIDLARIGFLGMSYGGGAITEFCKVDMRCSAALNLDGGTFGKRQRLPLPVPYLALLSPTNAKYFDYLQYGSTNDYYQVVVDGALHVDFTDASVTMPLLKWLNIAGEIDGQRAIDITNAVALSFFDAYLRDGPKPRFEDLQFSELTVVTNRPR